MTTVMQQEALSAPEHVAQQLIENQATIIALTKRLQENPPPFAFTIARGSSDHAASFANYLLSTQLGMITASLPPSIISIYETKLNAKHALAIAISQSGASPDICETLQAAREAGAITVAIVNNVNSQLANIAEYVLPMVAGEELAVAATKTYLTSLSAIVQLVATLSPDKSLRQSLIHLPESLVAASQCNWQIAQDELLHRNNLVVLARGVGYPIAKEAALKFKETSNIHAESFSAAEFQHGPMALVKKHFPILVFAQPDVSFAGTIATCQKLTDMQADTLLAVDPVKLDQAKMSDPAVARFILPLPPSLHPVCDPLLFIQAFYPMIAQLAVARGYNPDKPEHLRKVTTTR
jgi:glucosamine--fructose-6-phosphate aminotransferase (isomerizing)